MENKYKIVGDTATIYLKRPDGLYLETVIDTADLPMMDKFKGSLRAARHDIYCPYYVFGSIEVYSKKLKKHTNRNVSLHRFLMGFPEGLVVDHINEDTLNNKRSTNLQSITTEENVRKSKDNKSFIAKKRLQKSWISCNVSVAQKQEIMKRAEAVGMHYEYWVAMIISRELESQPWYETVDILANKRRQAKGERAYEVQRKIDLAGGDIK